jgi:hypothetical protein
MIFGIGLNKTGTISLHDALERLGFRSLHWGGPEVRKLVERALEEGRPLVEDLGEFDAFSDILCLSENFAVLDRQYPGSKFILTTRDLGEWLHSRRRHVERNRERKARGEYDGTFLEVDLAGWREEFLAHEARVHEYFAGRDDDFLVMNIAAHDGYEKLCPFLGVAMPAEPFPWRHRGARLADES